MKLYVVAGVVVLATFASAAFAQALKGPINDAPLTEHWWPSKWGADDKAGSANHTKNSANIQRALSFVKQYKTITIGKYYHREMPIMNPRKFEMAIPGAPTYGPMGKNAMVAHDELVTASIGQIGTQFDGPGHIGVNTSKGPLFYNGRLAREAYERSFEQYPGSEVLGMGPLGVEHVGELGFVCRLVVLDAVAYRKQQGKIPATADMLPLPDSFTSPGIVTADDVKGIMKMQGLTEIQPGDCVALHTGQGNLWSNDKYKSMTSEQRAAARALLAKGEPGFGFSACEYLASRDIALQMGDIATAEAAPVNEQQHEGYVVRCHTEGQTRHGIWHLENVDTKSLVDAKIYEGAFIWAPLRMIGATGSPGNPVVLY